MDILTYAEYKNLSPKQVDEATFNLLVKTAETVISIATRRAYEIKDINEDVAWRREAYKSAIAAQIDYFATMNATSYEEIQMQPQSISIGRTTVTTGATRTGRTKEEKPLLCAGAALALQGTGLLYRGIE